MSPISVYVSMRGNYVLCWGWGYSQVSLSPHHGLKRDTIAYFIEIVTMEARTFKPQIRRVIPNDIKCFRAFSHYFA